MVNFLQTDYKLPKGVVVSMWIVASVVIVLLVICILQKMRIKKQMSDLTDMLTNVKDIVYFAEVKPRLKYRYLSPTVNQLGSDYLKEHLINPEKMFEILHPDHHEQMKCKLRGESDFTVPNRYRLKNHQGCYVWFEEYATPIYKGDELVALQGVYRNIDEKVRLEERLYYELTHDVLTNTHNRTYFQTQMNHFNEVENIAMGIIICDLDELKAINDKFGHQMGDKLIIEAAKVLTETKATEEMIARIGGDEFAILLPHVKEEEVEDFISRIYQNLHQYNRQNPSSIVKMSIGYAYVNSSISNMENIFSEADEKMYASKRARKILDRFKNKESSSPEHTFI